MQTANIGPRIITLKHFNGHQAQVNLVYDHGSRHVLAVHVSGWYTVPDSMRCDMLGRLVNACGMCPLAQDCVELM